MTSDQVRAIAERAVKTFAQTFAAVILAADVASIYEVDWQQAAGVAALSAVLSVLTSVASWNVGSTGPSLGPEVTRDRHRREANRAIFAEDAEPTERDLQQGGE